MFQQKYIEEYQSITAPTELKDRVRFSVNKARRTMKQKMMMFGAMAAGITLFCVAGSLVWNRGLLGNNSTILSVNDVVVTREALPVDNQGSVLFTENLGHQKSLPIHIPMKIEIKGEAKANIKIEVSVGTIMQELDKKQYSAETTHMELSESSMLYWMLDGASDSIPSYSMGENGQKEYWTPGTEYEETGKASSTDTIPMLTITRGRTIAQYVVEYQVDTECYSIRKVN